MSTLPPAGHLSLDPEQLRAELPAPMIEARRWLLWDRDKVPHYTSGVRRSGTLDSPEDLSRLDTFDNALRAFRSGRYAGIGFALGPDADGIHWQGIDLDKLDEKPAAAAMAELLPGYVERSPSGRGLHALGIGRHFRTLGKNDTGIEAYAAGRYFTVTGDALRGDLEDLSEFVQGTLARAHSPRTSNAPTGDSTPPVLVTPDQVRELRSALFHMRSDGRDLWVRMAHALHELGDTGRGLWLDWSATSEKFDPADAARVWDSIKSADRTGYAAVFAAAQDAGWLNPRTRIDATDATDDDTETEHPADFAQVPIHDLGHADVPAPEYIVSPILPTGVPTLLGGHGGTGKSFLALVLAVCVAAGRDFMGLPLRRVRVMFYSAEDGKGVLRWRLQKICRALDIDPNELAEWLIVLDVTDVDPALFREAGESGVRAGVLTPAFAELNRGPPIPIPTGHHRQRQRHLRRERERKGTRSQLHARTRETGASDQWRRAAAGPYRQAHREGREGDRGLQRLHRLAQQRPVPPVSQ
jgi:hypothetical protein